MILIACVAGLAVLITVGVIAQRMEVAKEERARLIRDLSIRVRKYRSMLIDLPEGILTRDLKMFLVRIAARDLQTLVKLDKDNAEYVKRFEEMKVLLANVQKQPEDEAADLNLDDPNQVREVRARLRFLQQMILEMSAAGELDGASAKRFQSRLEEVDVQTAMQLHLQEARAATRKLRPSVAVFQIKQCREKLSRINASGRWNPQIAELEGYLANLEEHGALTAEEGVEIARLREEAGPPPEEQPSALAQGMEKLEAEEEEWKKKAGYD